MKAAISKENILIKTPCLTEPFLHPLRSHLEGAVGFSLTAWSQFPDLNTEDI